MGIIHGRNRASSSPNPDKRSKTTKSPTPVSPVVVDITNTKLFGISLAEAVTRAPSREPNIPYPLYSAIDFLNRKCLNEAGLYRIPGNKRVTEEYRTSFDRGQPIDFLAEVEKKPGSHDAHDVCGLVNLFMTSIPESLFTIKLRDLFQLKQFVSSPTVEINKEQDEQNKELKIERLHNLVWCDLMPEMNRQVLKYFVHHLYLIDKNSEKNRMTAKNLVISLFGVSPFSRTYYLLITNYERIFENPIAPQTVTEQDDITWLTKALEDSGEALNGEENGVSIQSKTSQSFQERSFNNRNSMAFAANRLSMSVDQLLTKGTDVRRSRRNVRERDAAIRELDTTTTEETDVSIASPYTPSEEPKKSVSSMLLAQKNVRVEIKQNESEDAEQRPIQVEIRTRQESETEN